ncbi:glutamate synthase, partial [Aduncisulcus paluster]
MMESWGVPSILLHAKAYEYASRLAAKGEKVVDLSFAGGFAKGSNIFKALAIGAPYAKMICMGRAMMIPGFLGANIEASGFNQKYGATAEEIFACYADVEAKVGKDEMKNIPLGAVGIWCLVDKLGAGLQQLLAGVRKFELTSITRDDIAS